jgi:subtilisin family serine protease
MKTLSFFLMGILFFSVHSLQSQETRMYRLILKDKGNAPCSLTHPENFLSQKSIDRRKHQGLPLDNFDLPLDPAYLDAIKNTGATIRTYSKWVKTVVVNLMDTTEILPRLESLPFIDSLYCVWKGILPETDNIQPAISLIPEFRQNTINSYGAGFTQIALNNGHLLHDAGFRGKGMSIAVLDGGFTNADIIEYFNQEQIKEIKNFNHETTDMLREGIDHGTRVLSCMLSAQSGEMTGTAPEADYYLFRTEVADSEFPVEEDYWVAALEYADSLGVDIVTSSVGYTTFDDAEMNHTYTQLDGQTIPISRAANMAASRGILLFNSAGNESGKNWEKIVFPSDAENIITVGSITEDSVRSSFSSSGLTADQRIKPDLMAMGTNVSVVTSSGKIIQANGTSFSTPIMAGLAACLWEACPDLNSFAMLQLLRKNANHYQNPDSLMGYGIADVYQACIDRQTGIKPASASSGSIYISINPSDNRLYINLSTSEQYNRCVLNVYTTLGNRILTASKLSDSIDISFLPKGIYIATVKIGDKQWVRKFIKNK